MNYTQAIEKLFPAFEQYYNLSKTTEAPFCATAEFRSHNEQYLLVRSAHIADIDSNEYIYFATEERLGTEKLTSLAEEAWKQGLAKITPYYGHKNSDITLIIFAEKIDEEVKKSVRKIKKYQSYKFGFFGWSRFKLILAQFPEKNYWSNSHGSDFKKLIEKTFRNA